MTIFRSWVIACILSLVGTSAISECLLVVASRDDQSQAAVILRSEFASSYESSRLVRVTNGRYAVTLGMLQQQPYSDVSIYVRSWSLPSDTFCMPPSQVVEVFAPDLSQSSEESSKSAGDVVNPTEDRFGFESCPRGYQPDAFPINECRLIRLPANARLDSSGNRWTCERGFQRRGQTCVEIDVPDNATLSEFGLGKGWRCQDGYRDLGDICEKIRVPPNASLNPLNTGYTCNLGFKDVRGACEAMNNGELLNALAASQRLARRLIMSAGGKSCREIEKLCEKVCDDEFYSSVSPTKRDCLKVCEEIENAC